MSEAAAEIGPTDKAVQYEVSRRVPADRDRRELAERFAHQQQTFDGAVDEVARLL